MADTGYFQLAGGFDSVGKGINLLFKSSYGVYFIVLLIITLLFKNIITSVIGKVPIFEGSGDQKVNASGNAIAWCISLLAVISIGYGMRNSGPDRVVTALAGPWGIFMIGALGVFVGYSIFKMCENLSKYSRWAWTIAVPLVICSWLYSYIIYSSPVLLWQVLGWIVFGLLLRLGLGFLKNKSEG
jgi:hypothetical protein